MQEESTVNMKINAADVTVKRACEQHTLFDALAYVVACEHERVAEAILDTIFKEGQGIQAAKEIDTIHRNLIRRVLEEYPVDRQYTDLMDRMRHQGVLEIKECTVKDGQIDITCPHCGNGDFFELPVSTGFFNCTSCRKKSVLRDLTR